MVVGYTEQGCIRVGPRSYTKVVLMGYTKVVPMENTKNVPRGYTKATVDCIRVGSLGSYPGCKV